MKDKLWYMWHVMLPSKLQNYNEFKDHIRWHDYLSIIIHEFPIVLIRRYDHYLADTKHDPCSVYLIQLFKICTFHKIVYWFK